MSKLLAFKGCQAGSPLKVLNKSATEAEIVIYAAIGQASWLDSADSMISAKQFSDALKALPDTVNTLNVRINSPGGDVFDGIAIYNRLKQHKAKKVVHIDGLAASIASIIALAGDEIIIGDGALYMIHLPWTYAMGSRTDLENTINRLMDVEEQMLGIYAKKTKMSKSEIRMMLEKETWMSASEAIDNGFADSTAEDTVAIAASAINSSWIAKKPGKYFSQEEATKAKVQDLKERVRSRLDRK
mgnify:CR=1 FL=1